MLDLIGIELTRIRSLAEQAGHDLLVYLIDLAILEANAPAFAHSDNPETPDAAPLWHDDPISHWELGQKLRVVRGELFSIVVMS